MRAVPPEVLAAMSRCLDEVEQELRERPCEEIASDRDLGWLFEDVVADWSVSILLAASVQRRDAELLVPLECQARKGRGLRGHQDDTTTRTVVLPCE